MEARGTLDRQLENAVRRSTFLKKKVVWRFRDYFYYFYDPFVFLPEPI